MKARIFGLLMAAVMGAPLAAQAQNLLGDWQGNIFYPLSSPNYGINLFLTSIFQTETPTATGDTFTGIFEVVCGAGAPADCGTQGFHGFTGSLSSNGAISINNSTGSSLMGSLSINGNTISGTGIDSSGTSITFDVTKKVAAPEIDPASAVSGLMLLLGTLAVVRGRRSIKMSAAAA